MKDTKKIVELAFREITEKGFFDIEKGNAPIPNVVNKPMSQIPNIMSKYVNECGYGCCFVFSSYMINTLNRFGINCYLIGSKEEKGIRASVMYEDNGIFYIANPVEDIEYFTEHNILPENRYRFYKENSTDIIIDGKIFNTSRYTLDEFSRKYGKIWVIGSMNSTSNNTLSSSMKTCSKRVIMPTDFANYNVKKLVKEYYYAKKYYLEHGDLSVPSNYEVKDECGNIVYLGKWIEKQKVLYKNDCLDKDEIEILENIGIKWPVKHNRLNNWMKKYNLAKECYKKNGNLLIPQNYKVVDESGNIINLGSWINNQRTMYRQKRLDKNKITLLDDIEMQWSIICKLTNNSWMKKYNLAKEYYKKNGNLLIPRNYKIVDESGNIINLGSWIGTQRKAYKDGKLNENRISLLESIKMVWTIKDFTILWEEYYLLLKEYKSVYGDLIIPKGYIYKGDRNKKYYLYDWVKKQAKDNLNVKQNEMLNLLDSNWNLSDEEKLLKYIDDCYEKLKNDELNASEIDELIKKGALKYSDCSIQKGNINTLYKNIKKRCI